MHLGPGAPATEERRPGVGGAAEQLAEQLVARANQRPALALALEVPALPVGRSVFVAARELDPQQDVGIEPLAERQPRERIDELDDRAAAEPDDVIGVEGTRRVGGKT